MHRGLARIPQGLDPAEDVETVQPLGPFGKAAAERLSERINRAEAFGQSPLYFAVIQSLNQFKAVSADRRRGIIVICEDENNTYHPPEPNSQSVPIERESVIESWERARVPIHFLQIGLGGEAENPELKELSEMSGGGYQFVKSGAELAKQLEAILMGGP